MGRGGEAGDTVGGQGGGDAGGVGEDNGAAGPDGAEEGGEAPVRAEIGGDDAYGGGWAEREGVALHALAVLGVGDGDVPGAAAAAGRGEDPKDGVGVVMHRDPGEEGRDPKPGSVERQGAGAEPVVAGRD